MNNLPVPATQKLTFFEKLQLYLFDDENSIPSRHSFSQKEWEIKKRYSTVFSYWIDKPTISEKKIVQFIENEFSLSKSQAYNDLQDVKLLIGNVRNATKEWQRFKMIAMLDKAFELAERKNDPKSMIMAADKLAKYTQLDKEDPQKIPYDEIVPQNFDITGDVTVLGIEKIPDLNERQIKLRKKYSITVEDVDIITDDKQ